MTRPRAKKTAAPATLPPPTVFDLVDAPELAAVILLEHALGVVIDALLAEHPTVLIGALIEQLPRERTGARASTTRGASAAGGTRSMTPVRRLSVRPSRRRRLGPQLSRAHESRRCASSGTTSSCAAIWVTRDRSAPASSQRNAARSSASGSSSLFGNLLRAPRCAISSGSPTPCSEAGRTSIAMRAARKKVFNALDYYGNRSRPRGRAGWWSYSLLCESLLKKLSIWSALWLMVGDGDRGEVRDGSERRGVEADPAVGTPQRRSDAGRRSTTAGRLSPPFDTWSVQGAFPVERKRGLPGRHQNVCRKTGTV